MNKKEIQIIKESYRNVYKANLEYECNPASCVDMRVLIDTLGLKEHRYEVENEVISDRNNYNAIIKDMFKMIFDDFKKHGIYVHYDLEEIDVYFYELQYEMSEEDISCYNSRMSYLKERLC